MEKENIPENDTDVFYDGVFHDFHKEWQGVVEESEKREEEIDYTKLSMKERAELLPPPTDNTMEEFEQFKICMRYSEEKLRSVRYKMEIYDDFLKEYDYRNKVKRMQTVKKRNKTIKKNKNCSR